MGIAYIALGANLGDPVSTIESAIEMLKSLKHSRLVGCSSLYRTAPVGLHNQSDFINAVVALDTQLTSAALLEQLFAVEAKFGRMRTVKNAPRTLDLDLLLHGDTICNDPQLTLPHPRMHLRAFVLAPLAEIAPEVFVPGHGMVNDMLATCADQKIERLL